MPSVQDTSTTSESLSLSPVLFDNHTNFAFSTVLTAPSPASSGASVTLQSGDGSKFPTPPFSVTIWPIGVQPTTTNAEIARVSAISGDVLTIVRAQEGSSARTVVVGDQIAATITKGNVSNIEGYLNGTNPSGIILSPILRSYGGWIQDTNTWTRVSNTQFTISSTTDYSAVFTNGTKLRCVDTTVKYFPVLNSSFSAGTTTVNLIPNDDYALATTPMTGTTYWSYDANPAGWPGWFDFHTTAAPVGWTGTPTQVFRFCVIGNFCEVQWFVTGTTNGTTTFNATTFTNPVTSVTNTNMKWNGMHFYSDNATLGNGICQVGSATNTVTIFKAANATWAASGTKTCEGNLRIEF